MYTLYGDGIHDDYPAIQEMIDCGVCEVSLPAPKKYYLISQTLVLPSNFRLVLPRFAEIRLADGANCYMLRNRWTEDYAERVAEFYSEEKKAFWRYVNRLSPSPEHVCENIEIIGGIWNFNNKNQNGNPLRTHLYDETEYVGYGMLFFNVKNFRMASMTLKDPVDFAVTINVASYFTIEDITFDFNYGNPDALNMDGIHLDGHCHYGYIRNLKGACYDDLVALNACEGYAGPITNIEIDGIFAEDCHSAVRLLALTENVSNIHISNIYGSYYQYCVTLSKYYRVEKIKPYDAITIEHVYASKAVRYAERYAKVKSNYIYPLIWIEKDALVNNLMLNAIHRREERVPVETIYIGENAVINQLIINDVTVENNTDRPIPMLVNLGYIKDLYMTNIRVGEEEKLVNNGVVEYCNGQKYFDQR